MRSITFNGKHDKAMMDEITALTSEVGFRTSDLNYIDISVELNTRMRTNGGTARLIGDMGFIQINYRLHKDNPSELKKTYLHELAHILQRYRHGYGKSVKSHGKEWQQIMRELGQEPEVYHKMDVSAYRNKHKRYKYSCGCRDWNLTARKHNKNVRHGGEIYSCRSCGEKLK